MEGTTATIRARRVVHRWHDRPLPRRFVGGDLLLSHLAAVLSASFPEGEAMFVRAVRRYRDRVDDPELAARVTGFVAQESIHAREHRRLNERLAELGYPTRHLDRRAGWGIRLVERLAPPIAMLAATAALEHATATLADVLLEHEDVQALFGDDELRALVLWHAVEEAEHRAVAFDVYRAVDGPEWLRTWALRVATVTTGLDFGSALITSLALDPDGRRPGELRRSWRWVRTSPFVGTGFGRAYRRYVEPGFHPSDAGSPELVAAWAERLFPDAPGA